MTTSPQTENRQVIRRARVRDAEMVHAVLLAAKDEIPLTDSSDAHSYHDWVWARDCLAVSAYSFSIQATAHHDFISVSVLRQARRRSTQLASSASGSVQLRSLRAR